MAATSSCVGVYNTITDTKDDFGSWFVMVIAAKVGT